MTLSAQLLRIQKKTELKEKELSKLVGQIEYLENELKKEMGETNIKKIEKKLTTIFHKLEKEKRDLKKSVREIEERL